MSEPTHHHQEPTTASMREFTQTMPKPPQSDLTAGIKAAAWYAGAFAVIGAVASKIPYVNRLFSRGMVGEAKSGAVSGAVIGGILGMHENAVHRHVVHPLEVENHVLKHALKETATQLNNQPACNHADKLVEERLQEQSADNQPVRS